MTQAVATRWHPVAKVARIGDFLGGKEARNNLTLLARWMSGPLPHPEPGGPGPLATQGCWWPDGKSQSQ